MRRYLAALLLCFAGAVPVAAAPVTINFPSVISEANNGAGTVQDVNYSTAYGTRTLSSALDGNTSTTYIDWQDTGAGALFDFDFAHVRTGAPYSYGLSNATFTITVGPSDTTYSLSGLYSMTGPASQTYSDVYLYDATTGVLLFRDTSLSFYTANESFILGVAGDADYYNDTTGSLTGELLAGHEYQLYFANHIQAYPVLDDAGATATGCVTLSIGGAPGGGACGVAPVPLPAAAWLLLSGLAGFGFVARRRTAA